jgi:hypothetical protein
MTDTPKSSRTLRFSIHIDGRDFLRYYQGQGQWVMTRTLTGEKLRFPAAWLRPFVTAGGIDGLFELEFDEHFKKKALRRIA